MITVDEIQSRARRLLGHDNMHRLETIRVIVIGVGGVGSWCVESLVRSGVRHVTIVDCDRVAVSNINRQLMATTETVGQVKVDALKAHLLTVNPAAEIDARREVFCAENAAGFDLDSYDYIIDCIDSLKDKALLIETATRTHARFYSSMGAALKLDPTRVQVAEFWHVTGCPLARALRQRFKRQGIRPARKFQCVYSDELLENLGPDPIDETFSDDLTAGPQPSPKARINGSLMHITAMFGLTLAGLVIKDVMKKS
ncbi:MAG: tRNA threonylcarbamoyladenosine dehydratase [Muribaculaceae bacterium]|nr:tRNA threonylcarbamoyladenosine dehydratase [Muribaculaceae bacterium]